MNVPRTITLTIGCEQGGDLSGLIVYMIVTSGTKNPYYIYFPKTSLDGKTQLTAEQCRDQFNDHGDTFMMDYNGTVEGAPNAVSLELYDSRLLATDPEESLRWPLSQYEQKVWKSRQEFVD